RTLPTSTPILTPRRNAPCSTMQIRQFADKGALGLRNGLGVVAAALSDVVLTAPAAAEVLCGDAYERARLHPEVSGRGVRGDHDQWPPAGHPKKRDHGRGLSQPFTDVEGQRTQVVGSRNRASRGDD